MSGETIALFPKLTKTVFTFNGIDVEVYKAQDLECLVIEVPQGVKIRVDGSKKYGTGTLHGAIVTIAPEGEKKNESD